MAITQWASELQDDIRFALRQMRRAPTFTVVAVATLAFGLGANGAMFSLVDATLLRPLPFRHPDRLVSVWETSESASRDDVSPVNAADWEERSQLFDNIAGFIPNVGAMVMASDDGIALTVPRQWVTQGVFDALEIQPVVGRTFSPEDEQREANVVLLSEAFWRARFAGDRDVVGRELRLDGAPYTVVGVLPEEAQMVGRTSMWALTTFDNTPALRGSHFLQVVGRLKPDVTLDDGAAELSTIAGELALQFPDTNAGRGAKLEPLRQTLIQDDLRWTSLLFIGVVSFVLLICCANVASLLMARASVRSRELAIRSVLGAGRSRVVRQLLTESLVLAVLGGALGIALGAAILEAAPSVIPAALLQAAVALSFDWRVVGFCATAALFVGLLFGLAPAWRAASLTSTRVISSEGRSVTVSGGLLRQLLVVGEVATAVVLVFGAGLLLRTLIAVDTVDRGYRADSVLTMLVDPLGRRYPTPERLLGFYDTVEREVRGVPGVAAVGWATTLPMGDSIAGSWSFEIVGDPPENAAARPSADLQIVSTTYFDALDLPLLSGRRFDDHDTADRVPVCIVNEALVQKHLSGRSPIGRQIAVRPADEPQAEAESLEIVGVARQVKARPDEQQALLQIYVPLNQAPIDDIYMFVRPEVGPAAALSRQVRAAIGRVDKEQLVTVDEVTTLESIARDATGRHRLRAVIVATFAVLALLLAMVGVFGVLTYSVQQSLRDLAMRRALGATTGDLARLVVRSAAKVVVSGAVIGLLLSALFGRLLTSMLFGVEALDPATFLGVLLVLTLSAALSLVGPAWRAIRIDPAIALRDS